MKTRLGLAMGILTLAAMTAPHALAAGADSVYAQTSQDVYVGNASVNLLTVTVPRQSKRLLGIGWPIFSRRLRACLGPDHG